MFFYVYRRNVQTSQQVSLCVTAFISYEIFLLCLRVLLHGEYHSSKLISVERVLFSRWVVLETDPGDFSNHKQSSSFVLIGQLVKLAGHFKFHVSMTPPCGLPNRVREDYVYRRQKTNSRSNTTATLSNGAAFSPCDMIAQFS